MNIANGNFTFNSSFYCNRIYHIVCAITPSTANQTVTWNVGTTKNNKRIPIPYITATGKCGYAWIESGGKFTITCTENTAYIINASYLMD